MILPAPRVLAVSGPLALAATDASAFDAWLDGLATAGVDAVQLRDRGLDDLDLYRLARQARRRLPAACRVVVNARIDVALAAGADGVHLPAAGLPVASLRRRFGDGVLIGRSTHRAEEVAAAAQGGADYATFGPVFATPSKAAFGEPPGLAGLARAVAAGRGLPVIGLGGIGVGELAAVAAAGAAGVAAIRALADPATAAAFVAEARRVFPH